MKLPPPPCAVLLVDIHNTNMYNLDISCFQMDPEPKARLLIWEYVLLREPLHQILVDGLGLFKATSMAAIPHVV